MAFQIFTGDRKKLNEAHEFAEVMHQQNKKIDPTTGAINLSPWMRHISPHQIGYTITKFATKYAKEFTQVIKNNNKI